MYEDRNGTDIYYYYDSYGTPTAIRYYEADGTSHRFFLATNQQGDIIGIYNASGNMVVKYEYDAWGNIIAETNATGGTPTSLAQKWSDINPFRYRGYYYDAETGLYYLNSRYYDSETGRFLNADDTSVINATPNALVDKNLFAYCDNNLVARIDNSGKFWGLATLASAAVGGLISAVADAAVQLVTTGSIDVAQTAIAGITGAISGACALIPGGKAITTVVSGAINAGLNAGSYAVNQWRKGEKIDSTELCMSAGVGFISGVAGNLFRFNSTSVIKNTGETLIEKGTRKMVNGVVKNSTSTINRGFQYWDKGISMIYKYATRAGTNSGFGSVLGSILSYFIPKSGA